VGAGQTLRGLLHDERELGDELLIQCNAVVRLGRLGQDLGPLGVGYGQELDSLSIGLRRANDRGNERLASQLGLLLG
jgi:hypothetical protein